jgi:hypothetical protein
MSKVYRTAHTVYCLNYHFVWLPKYRRDVLTGYVGERAKEIFHEIAERYEFKIEAVNMGEDHASGGRRAVASQPNHSSVGAGRLCHMAPFGLCKYRLCRQCTCQGGAL